MTTTWLQKTEPEDPEADFVQSRRGVILLSGGLDSTVAMVLAKAQGFDLLPIFFRYGQPAADIEGFAAQVMATRHLGIEPTVVNLPEICIVQGSLFPLRNLNLISQAASIASGLDRPHIFVGICSAEAPESEGCQYNDCSPEFLDALQETLQLCDERLILHAPLIDTPKRAVFSLAAALSIDIVETFSCLEPRENEAPCGECVSCRERAGAQRAHLGA